MSSDSSDVEIEIIDSDSDTNTRTLRTRSASVQGKDSKNNYESFTEPEVRKLVSDLKFLSDFDPEKSSREKRKLSRKVNGPTNQKSVYDEKGRYRHDKSRIDLCDCLVKTCPGCHFPCPNCKNSKCGAVCRVNRKWAYEMIEHDGKDLVIRNGKVLFTKTGV